MAEDWINDKLHALLGYTDSSLASFLLHKAKKAKSPDEIAAVLKSGGVPNAHTFASDLFDKYCSRSNRKRANNDVESTSNAAMIQRAKEYTLVDYDDSEAVSVPSAEKPKEQEKSLGKEKESKSNGRKRRKPSSRNRRTYSSSSEDEGDDNGENTQSLIEQYHQRRNARYYGDRKESEDEEVDDTNAVGSKLSKAERAEIERHRDLTERDEFVKRMLDRDNHKTKQKSKSNVDSAADVKAAKESALMSGHGVIDEETGKVITMNTLRDKSRRSYLKKREEKELLLLERQLADEEEMFGGSDRLTEAERKRIEMQREILQMAKKRNQKANELYKNDEGYHLPDEIDETKNKADRDKSILTSRYVEEKIEKTEQELWEESQTHKAIHQQRKHKNDEKSYDLLFDEDEEIEFVSQEVTKAYDHRRKGEPKEDFSDESSKALTPFEKIQVGRKKLPVYPYRQEFLAAVKDHKVLVLVGATGSGKTTQLVQYLHEVGYSELGKIGCTQPRRVAAMSVAARVAQEMGCKLGHEVGYSIRFENCTNKSTIIQYMTDGMLLREFLTEPDLSSYSCLIIDEAHERTLHTDILFGLVKDIARYRDDLKLIISSATLDAEKFSKYFDDASIFMIPGRMYPVEIFYTKSPEADYVDAAIVTVLQIHVTQPLNGDILIFLTGQEEIESAADALTEKAKELGNKIKELVICPIFANLPSEQQAKIFEKTPKGARKVVIATNIAETSLTIDGICYVIDSGFVKQKSFNARSGMESLLVTPISQAAAQQRSGRAGRTQPGKCFRLYTAWSFQHELEPNTIPEILRTNMNNVVLMLKSLGIDDLIRFDFMDAPPADTLIRALEQLYALGALNDHGELTKLGRRMAEFPLEPMLSKSVLASEKYKCTSEVLSMCSMLSVGSTIFYRPKDKEVHADTARMNFARGGGGDHMTLLRCYADWADNAEFSTQWCFENFVQVKTMRKARDIRDQLEGLCERVEVDHLVSSPDDQDSILKCVTAGFFYNTAKMGKSGDYTTIKQKKTVYIHPSSVLSKEEELPRWLLYFELTFTTKEFMRQVAPIKPHWLFEIAPHFYREEDVEDSRTKRVPKTKK